MTHVLISTNDVELALDATWALEDAGYGVDYARRITRETRAELQIPPSAIVLDCTLPRVDVGVVRSWVGPAHISLVVVSSTADGPLVARSLGAAYVPGPSRTNGHRFTAFGGTVAWRACAPWTARLAEAVARRAGDDADERGGGSGEAGEGFRMPPVLIVAHDEVARAVASLVLRKTGIRSVLAADAAAAVAYLGEPGPSGLVSVAVVEPVMLRRLSGSALAHALRVLGVPTLTLQEDAGGVEACAAAAVNDILPVLFALLDAEPD